MLKPITTDEVHTLRDDIEDDLLVAVSDALKAFLLRVRAAALRAVESGSAGTLVAAAGDEIPTLGQLQGWWSETVDAAIVADVNAALDKAWAKWTDITIEANPAQEATNAYIANVRDRLVEGSHFGVPVYADSFNRIRQGLATSAAEGWTRPQLAEHIAAQLSWEEDGPYWRSQKQDADDKIDAYLDKIPAGVARDTARLNDPRVAQLRERRNEAIKHLDAERSVWETRATLIARTEATGGANFGAYRALKAEGVATKVWEATADARTRPSHSAAGDQEVGIDDYFIVGGAMLQFPGDPAGPVTEVANCRCAMIGGDYFKADAPVGVAAPTAVAPPVVDQQAALEKKWKGKPPPKPVKGLPEKPQPGIPDQLARLAWKNKVAERYSAFTNGKDLAKSNNYTHVQRAIGNDRAPVVEAVNYLHKEKYLDDQLRAEILKIWEDAATISPEKLAAYKKELGLAKRRLRGHSYAMRDWRLANGIDETAGLGMDGAKAFDDDFSGIQFARSDLPTVHSGTVGQRVVKEYTADHYTTINQALHAKAENPAINIPDHTQKRIDDLDKLFQPLGHDIYLHRGTNWNELTFPGGVQSLHPTDPLALLGTVQRQPGYLSTSIGTQSAFSGRKVQILFRAPANTKGLNVMEVGNYGDAEREILLGRDVRYFIHSVRKGNSGQWLIEAEIIPEGVDASTYVPRALTTKVNAHGPSGS